MPKRLFQTTGYGARVLKAWEIANATLAWGRGHAFLAGTNSLPGHIEDSFAEMIVSALKFSRDLEGLMSPLSRLQFYGGGLKWALEKEWLVLGWVFSRLIDFNRSRFFQALSKLDSHCRPGVDSSSPRLELDRAVVDLQGVILKKLEAIVSPLRNSSVSQRLGEMIVSENTALPSLIVPSRLRVLQAHS